MEMFTLTHAEQVNAVYPTPSVNWEAVFRQHGKKLYHFIYKRVGNHDDVEDLQQMTYLEVLKHQDKFAGASRPETWVFGIALNLVRNYFRQARLRSQEIGDEALEHLAGDADPGIITESQNALKRALEAMAYLPEDTCQMLIQLVDSDASYQDLAVRLNIPIGTVRSRLSRARYAIRRAVDA
ncbi:MULTISPECIES: RNA polymerase sigma factor [unclassified Brenneria]|uniref:RNA polymerase sigma factor n=1 Tax=unclassified Brenneria TaxID=2634434 RepID=UPI0015576340|nr:MULTISPECIES: RNA polymerase sigma factor [unclassified Brenneria]MBJ7220895.1 RNA polymerase sigma factor [Brenneria sp. L3-3C-1]MEE3642136.1 RNA polymerase sigma factor [Brenneria sp. L3_3C_1]MEE3650491.1 RNA polymerase sigma factor [Brenneria sp. HEZEL_4_2_4]NPD00447.1 RNA polymerase sigma factor [Brenneria sp. hezel4-2-4]